MNKRDKLIGNQTIMNPGEVDRSSSSSFPEPSLPIPIGNQFLLYTKNTKPVLTRTTTKLYIL